MRRLKALKNLRAILRDVEIEAFEVARSQADLESATLRVYANKMRDMNEQVENIISVGKQALVELLIASAAGYATVGLAGAAIPAGAAIATGVTNGLRVRRIRRDRRQSAWLGVMDAIGASVP